MDVIKSIVSVRYATGIDVCKPSLDVKKISFGCQKI